ncbi:threonine synthase [Chitinimonas koreensis]|uniref:threonine synthase n=1 Tax=Chitinimonas koreensis TaxID=356302 RepID=UPI00041C4D50|nr:threonine synthase [Chitinimonas koreensis]QNM95727.1 threonine synthase [Chitinimonas koreensis]
MNYISTRGGMAPQTFTDILLGGLAPDGGLVVPDTYPRIEPALLEAWSALSYAELAFEIVSRFATDIPAADVKRLVEAAYTPEAFGHADITPLTELEPGLHLLHLSNGPTLAFKDIAMQLLGQLFEYVLDQRGETINIVGATSGDTGSAAEYAMRGKRGVNVFMLSPHGRMSPFQRAQMFSLPDANIHNLAVEGTFDDCQDIVKAINNDAGFKAKYKIGAVNSINWGRVVAQVVYYFRAYLAVAPRIGAPVDFVVPSGNFGNICAGHIARQMGLPVGRLIVATNENDVLDEFFRTGLYRVRGSADTHATSSPSMDISKASNLERFVFDLIDRDGAELARLWQEVDSTGGFDLGKTRYFARMVGEFGFASGKSTHADRIATIRAAHARWGVVIDPHTADGVKVALETRRDGVPMVTLETALPAKFEATIVEALGSTPPRPAELADLEQRPQRSTVMANDAALVKAFIQQALDR